MTTTKKANSQADTSARMETANATIEVAKSLEEGSGDTVTLSTGVRAILRPVSASLIDEVTTSIKEPDIPIWHNEDKGRDEQNLSDPQYLRDMDTYERKRGIAAIDAMVMFGVELVDGLPEDDTWVKRLKFMEKRGLLDLTDFDADDNEACEFFYKRFIAVSNDDISQITAMSGVSKEDVDKAADKFQSKKG